MNQLAAKSTIETTLGEKGGLRPGIYSVKAEAEGFDPQQNDTVFPGLGQKHRTAAEN